MNWKIPQQKNMWYDDMDITQLHTYGPKSVVLLGWPFCGLPSFMTDRHLYQSLASSDLRPEWFFTLLTVSSHLGLRLPTMKTQNIMKAVSFLIKNLITVILDTIQ